MQMRDEMEDIENEIDELEDEIAEDIEPEETVEVKKKDKIPPKSFAALIRDYQKEGYSTRESMEKAYRTMYPVTKPKVWDFHLMPSFPESNLENYKNSYILVVNELKYITAEGQYEPESVPITNMDVLLSKIAEINQNCSEKLHLCSKQIKKLITLNGGHTPPKIKKEKKPPKKKIDKIGK